MTATTPGGLSRLLTPRAPNVVTLDLKSKVLLCFAIWLVTMYLLAQLGYKFPTGKDGYYHHYHHHHHLRALQAIITNLCR